MKITFNILVFIACGVAAYFSLTHKEQFESQQKDRLTTIATNRSVTATADGLDVEIAQEQAKLRETEANIATATASLESTTATGRSLSNQVAEIDSTLKSQQDEISRLNDDIKNVLEKLNEFGTNPTPETIPQTIAQLETQRDDLVKEKNELIVLIESAEKDLASKQAEAGRVAARIAERIKLISSNATEAVISAVNHDWGFVLIAAGSNNGFNPQGPLLVKRDGRVIGRLRPSSIESNQTVAEIDYASVSSGVRFQPGDRVMFARTVAN